jgi:hypothetical protein
MDIFALQSDGCAHLLASGLDPQEVMALQDQWRYIKPFGSNIRIIVNSGQSHSGFSTTGTEPEKTYDAPRSEMFFG